MAKDVVFESEKYMQRQETKRKWLPVLCLAAILLAVIVIALIIRGSRGVVYTGGEDTPYPYSWSIDRKGELKLEIDKSAAEGYTWAASDYDISGLEIGRPEKQPQDKSSFTIKPNAAGRYVSVFSLVNKEDRSDCIYEWRFLMDSAQITEGETSSAGPLSILSGTGMELGGKKRNTEEDALSYTIAAGPDGTMTVELINPAQGSVAAGDAVRPVKDKDEGDVVSEEKRGEEDGGAPDDSQGSAVPLESTVITDPAEIEEFEGIPYDELVEQLKAAEKEKEAVIYNYSWTVTSDNEGAVSPAGVFYTGEMAIASLNAGNRNGTASVSVHNDRLGLEVYAVVTNLDGQLTIDSYGSRSYEPVPVVLPEPEEGQAETEETSQP
ncbi:MAG: hypothetical protein J5555_08400 [Firmicutes bacterium]|nr:hypothetical protein [Bacillota bacterium]